MSILNFLKESLSIKKSIELLEIQELIEILKNYEERNKKIQKKPMSFRSPWYLKNKEDFIPVKADKMIEALNKVRNLKGIPLLTKFIDILKQNGLFENSPPIIELANRYGSQIYTLYVRQDPESPPFIRKGVNF